MPTHHVTTTKRRRKPRNRTASPGLNGAESFVERKVVDTYKYRDLNGKTLYEVLRYEPKDFSQHQVKKDGTRTRGRGSARPVPYRLKELDEAVREANENRDELNPLTVYVAEGEKSVHRLEKLGVVATTGASAQWKPAWAEYFSGDDPEEGPNPCVNVLVIADRDRDMKGYRWACKVYDSLVNHVGHVRIVRSATTGPGDDVVEHLDAGYGLDELKRVPKKVLNKARKAAETDSKASRGTKGGKGGELRSRNGWTDLRAAQRGLDKLTEDLPAGAVHNGRRETGWWLAQQLRDISDPEVRKSAMRHFWENCPQVNSEGDPDPNSYSWEDALASLTSAIENWPDDWEPGPFAFPPRDSRRLVFRSLTDVQRTMRPPSWLIKGLWLSEDFGVVGGPEKTLKTWFLTMVGIAVASGKPFLGNDAYVIPDRRRVLYLSGEGGSELIVRRVAHGCKAYGLSIEDLGEELHVSDQVIPASDSDFKDSMLDAIETHDPGLVIVDPAYVYLAGEEAGNVFNMGQALRNDLQAITQGRALMVSHHTTKDTREPELGDLSQAGFREWVQTAILLWHREPPDLESQNFKLGTKVISRNGFGDRFGLDVGLGKFNLDTLTHEGEPTWEVTQAATGSGGLSEEMMAFLDALLADPLSQKGLGDALGWGPDRVKRVATEAGGHYLIETSDGPRNSKLHSITPEGRDYVKGSRQMKGVITVS